MAAYAICGECDREYRLADSMAGQLIRCKECGADVEVPERRSDRARSAPRPTRETPSLRPRRSRTNLAGPRRPRVNPGRRRPADRQSGGISFWHIRLIVGGVAALIVIIGTALGVIVPRYRGSPSPQRSANKWNTPASSRPSTFGDSVIQPGIGGPESASEVLAQQMEASQRRMDEAAARMQRDMDELRRSAFPDSPSFPSGFGDSFGGVGSPGTGRSRFGPGSDPDLGRSGFPGAGSRNGIGGSSVFPSRRGGVSPGYSGR